MRLMMSFSSRLLLRVGGVCNDQQHTAQAGSAATAAVASPWAAAHESTAARDRNRAKNLMAGGRGRREEENGSKPPFSFFFLFRNRLEGDDGKKGGWVVGRRRGRGGRFALDIYFVDHGVGVVLGETFVVVVMEAFSRFLLLFSFFLPSRSKAKRTRGVCGRDGKGIKVVVKRTFCHPSLVNFSQ